MIVVFSFIVGFFTALAGIVIVSGYEGALILQHGHPGSWFVTAVALAGLLSYSVWQARLTNRSWVRLRDRILANGLYLLNLVVLASFGAFFALQPPPPAWVMLISLAALAFLIWLQLHGGRLFYGRGYVLLGFLGTRPPRPAETAQGVDFLRRAFEKGHLYSANTLAHVYEHGKGVAKDPAEAAKWARLAAEKGFPPAQANLGRFYAVGFGVTQNWAEAEKWYRRAAEKGDASAQRALGSIYFHGTSGTKDVPAGIDWFRKAAQQGNADACTDLGIIYMMGDGVEKDEPQGLEWCRKGAAKGSPVAQFNMGVLCQEGKLVTKDLAAAVRWYRQAAGRGFPSAMYNLGLCYRDGQGVEKNVVEAAASFIAAEKLGHKASAEILARLAPALTPQQLSAAEERARQILALPSRAA